MKSYEIFWDDLTEEAKERLAEVESGNNDIPIAIIDIEDEDADYNWAEEHNDIDHSIEDEMRARKNHE